MRRVPRFASNATNLIAHTPLHTNRCLSLLPLFVCVFASFLCFAINSLHVYSVDLYSVGLILCLFCSFFFVKYKSLRLLFLLFCFVFILVLLLLFYPCLLVLFFFLWSSLMKYLTLNSNIYVFVAMNCLSSLLCSSLYFFLFFFCYLCF